MLRRLDCVLDATKPAVMKRNADLAGRIENVVVGFATWVERSDADAVDRTAFEDELLRRGFTLRENGWRRTEGLLDAVHAIFEINAQTLLDAVG